MNTLSRGIILFLGLILLWETLVITFSIPPYILPTPLEVFNSLFVHKNLLCSEAMTTITETLLGLILGILFGCATALCMVFFRPITLWLLPILLISQAIPTFAIAPLLVIWLGYGMSSKIATTVLMLFFPITSAFFDGLRRTDKGWLDLAKTMQAKKWRVFWYIRIPAALPSLASGMRVATAIAPIGAVVGEWVGASKGLGYLMLNSNERMQIDLMFAALITLIVFSLLLYFSVDKLLRKLIPWQIEA
ncbi:MAG: ABC transporter permease [Gammaproteobacteria bacterium]|nr:ABC transporter permease [Gammaproteobacteria bacterium]